MWAVLDRGEVFVVVATVLGSIVVVGVVVSIAKSGSVVTVEVFVEAAGSVDKNVVTEEVLDFLVD